MDNSMDSVQKPVPLLTNEDQVDRNGNNSASQNPQLVESTRDQQSFSKHVCQTSPKRLEEAASDGSKMQDCTDRLQNDNTEHSFSPESQVKSKPKKVFITEKGDILHDNEAMEHIQASRKSEANTQVPKDSKDIFISPDGKIQIGEEAIIAKALHDIEKSCSKPSRSFTVTLKHPKVDETEQHGDEADKNTGSSVESSHNLSEENEDTHQEDFTDDSPQIEHCSGDEGQNEEQNNTASYVQSFEGDSNRNELLIANEIDQQACIQVEIDCNSSEDNFGSENSDHHRELDQSTSGTSIAAEIDILTQDDDNEEFSDTEEDGHRLLQQRHSSVTFKVNEHTKSKMSSSKEVFEAKKTIASSEVKAATTDSKGINEKVQCLASETIVKGGEVRVATAETKLIDTQVKAGTMVTKVKGAEVKVATSDMKGLHAQAGASVNVSTKGSTTTAGRVELKGADVDIEATAEPTAQGASINTGTATITGVQERIKADVKATSSGAKIQAGVADVSGIKFGATAEASVEATGLDVKVGTAKVSVIEASATASVSASTGAEVSLGNARVTGFDGIGASASVSTRSGVQLFSAQTGISGHAGIQVSNTTKVGCVSLTPGLPKVGFGNSILSFGFGGLNGGQSGTYAAVATVGNPEGSSRHGNSVHGGNAGNGSHDNGPGNSITGSTSEISSVQGSSGLGGGIEGHSGIHSGSVTVQTSERSLRFNNECGQNGEFLSDKNVPESNTEGNSPETTSAQVSLDALSVPFSGSVSGGSTTIGGNSTLCSGISHNHPRQELAMIQDNSAVPELQDKMEPKISSETVKLNEQPFHLKVLQTLECEHLGDNNAPLCTGQTAVLTNVSRQQLSAAKCDIQLQGTEAKLQAKINQLYPSSRGSGKPEPNKTVEQIKSSTIKRLNNEGKVGTQSPESRSTTSANNSINNPSSKKAKPFGPQKKYPYLRLLCNGMPKGNCYAKQRIWWKYCWIQGPR